MSTTSSLLENALLKAMGLNQDQYFLLLSIPYLDFLLERKKDKVNFRFLKIAISLLIPTPTLFDDNKNLIIKHTKTSIEKATGKDFDNSLISGLDNFIDGFLKNAIPNASIFNLLPESRFLLKGILASKITKKQRDDLFSFWKTPLDCKILNTQWDTYINNLEKDILSFMEEDSVDDSTKITSKVSWDQTLENSKKQAAETIKNILSGKLLFNPKENDYYVIHDINPTPLWFIGDLHGDILALENAWEYIKDECEKRGEKPNVLFLGDFLDRGKYNHEIIIKLFSLIEQNPGRIGVLAGNHDENLSWNSNTNLFESAINPSEYCTELNSLIKNEDSDSLFKIDIGKVVCQFFSKCPRAIFFPDGLFVSHAGFPHTDRLEYLNSISDLNDPFNLQDFTWLRASNSSPRKRPNRSTRGCEFGFEDLKRFSEHMKTKFDIKVNRFLRGHDHIEERHWSPPSYNQIPMLTINTMCRKLEDEYSEKKYPLACIAEYIPNELPKVHFIKINNKDIDSAFYTP